MFWHIKCHRLCRCVLLKSLSGLVPDQLFATFTVFLSIHLSAGPGSHFLKGPFMHLIYLLPPCGTTCPRLLSSAPPCQNSKLLFVNTSCSQIPLVSFFASHLLSLFCLFVLFFVLVLRVSLLFRVRSLLGLSWLSSLLL